MQFDRCLQVFKLLAESGGLIENACNLLASGLSLSLR
jgi:hypothetical protein